METVAIVGVGLLGGSLAMDLRRCGYAGRILGVSRSPREYPAAFSSGAVFERAAAESDVIVLCSPVQSIIADIERVDALVRPGTLITDVGSTKSAIMSAARTHVKRGVFLGGHPMAGKHVSGLEHACEGLYSGKAWFFVRTIEPDPPVVREFVEWVGRIGARPLWIGEEEHDRSVAMTSHLPQLVSTALGAALARSVDPGVARQRCGQGLPDMLRLAESDWALWRDILTSNRLEIRRMVGEYLAALGEIEGMLSDAASVEEIREAFERSQEFARVVREKR